MKVTGVITADNIAEARKSQTTIELKANDGKIHKFRPIGELRPQEIPHKFFCLGFVYKDNQKVSVTGAVIIENMGQPEETIELIADYPLDEIN